MVASEQQYFDQYTTANIALYNANNHTLASVFMGGISYYDYVYPNGPLQTTVGPPTFSPAWVDRRDHIVQEEWPRPRIHHAADPRSRLLRRCFVGFLNPSVPVYSNGVIKLRPSD